ncbi:MAG: dipeptide epimerase [Bacteroidia bacterium]|nr:dipeptide epimerase [Bacteroidia bacterium]
MQHWSVQTIILDLKYTWKISRNATDTKTNLIVTIREGQFSGQGEAAPNIRYQESPELLQEQFALFLKTVPEQFLNVESINEFLDQQTIAPSLRFAIESAYHHLQAAKKNITVPQQLGLSDPGSVYTSYTIPIMDPGVLRAFYDENKLSRFKYLKVKINTEEGFETIRYLSSFTGQSILLDPNEAFLDVEECIYFLEKSRKFAIEFVEQPLPAGKDEEYRYLKKYSAFPLFADESILHEADFKYLKSMFDGVNVKLMKAGSYTKAIELLKNAKSHGMKTMIGCMVETSLGISSGLHLCSLCDYADLDSFMIVKDEPYKLILENEGKIEVIK